MAADDRAAFHRARAHHDVRGAHRARHRDARARRAERGAPFGVRVVRLRAHGRGSARRACPRAVRPSPRRGRRHRRRGRCAGGARGPPTPPRRAFPACGAFARGVPRAASEPRARRPRGAPLRPRDRLAIRRSLSACARRARSRHRARSRRGPLSDRALAGDLRRTIGAHPGCAGRHRAPQPHAGHVHAAPIGSAGRAARSCDGAGAVNPRRVAGVVLAGGRAERLGGLQKPLLLLDGEPLVAHVLAALRDGLGDDALLMVAVADAAQEDAIRRALGDA
ncbi:MAG: NTP transferase domain-containing protein, partial [Deltaproteobacteria bacterium]|nr:NTP transferase domain-containing protein [Deltaproteobacteria bacterium]